MRLSRRNLSCQRTCKSQAEAKTGSLICAQGAVLLIELNQMTTKYLFQGPSIFDVLQNQKAAVLKAVQDLGADYLLNASEHDLLSSLVAQFQLEVPVVKEDEIHVADFSETDVNVSHDPGRVIFDRSQPFYMKGSKTIIAVPFSGDSVFFDVHPQCLTWQMNAPPIALVEGAIHLTFVRTDQNAEAIKREYSQLVTHIKVNLESLRSSVLPFNEQLESLVKQVIAERKGKLLADAGMVAALGLPIRKRQGVPTTYAVPMQRRKPRIERPHVLQAQFKTEPTLAAEEYDEILKIIRSMVRVMEQSPRAFEKMGEEDLRTHFLVQLNAQYEGQATGETFNFQGKTDILIRAEGRNVFIAECKFWKGEKEFQNTIDQLLSYLSWRDTKTAILIFNRNANFTDVLTKIGNAGPLHPCFKRDLGKSDESAFRYVFHQPADTNRELLLTVMAFDVPRPDQREVSTV
jgi:hypothetical protein